MSNNTVICCFGKTLDGKSSFLNTILSKHEFQTSDDKNLSLIDSKGIITTETKYAEGFWFGDNKKMSLGVIDTPGLIDNFQELILNENNSKNLFTNLLTLIELCAKKEINIFFFVFKVNNIKIDNQFLNVVEVLIVLFGREFFDHLGIIFTFCDDQSSSNSNLIEKIKDLEINFNKKLKESFRKDLIVFDNDLPLFFVSNKTKEGFNKLEQFLLTQKKLNCDFLTKLKELENNGMKKEDLDKYVEEEFKKALLGCINCSIL